jgi:hypothetical protein
MEQLIRKNSHGQRLSSEEELSGKVAAENRGRKQQVTAGRNVLPGCIGLGEAKTAKTGGPGRLIRLGFRPTASSTHVRNLLARRIHCLPLLQSIVFTLTILSLQSNHIT